MSGQNLLAIMSTKHVEVLMKALCARGATQMLALVFIETIQPLIHPQAPPESAVLVTRVKSTSLTWISMLKDVNIFYEWQRQNAVPGRKMPGPAAYETAIKAQGGIPVTGRTSLSNWVKIVELASANGLDLATTPMTIKRSLPAYQRYLDARKVQSAG